MRLCSSITLALGRCASAAMKQPLEPHRLRQLGFTWPQLLDELPVWFALELTRRLRSDNLAADTTQKSYEMSKAFLRAQPALNTPHFVQECVQKLVESDGEAQAWRERYPDASEAAVHLMMTMKADIRTGAVDGRIKCIVHYESDGGRGPNCLAQCWFSNDDWENVHPPVIFSALVPTDLDTATCDVDAIDGEMWVNINRQPAANSVLGLPNASGWFHRQQWSKKVVPFNVDTTDAIRVALARLGAFGPMAQDRAQTVGPRDGIGISGEFLQMPASMVNNFYSATAATTAAADATSSNNDNSSSSNQQ